MAPACSPRSPTACSAWARWNASPSECSSCRRPARRATSRSISSKPSPCGWACRCSAGGLVRHDGEINPVWGKRSAVLAREPALAAPGWGRDVELLKPVIWGDGSDSTSLDNAFELLVRSGRDPVHALMMLLPEAWERIPDMPPALRSFYEYHAGLMEPWDGPAALAFSDGVVAGSALDRNGLRPCRYNVTP